VTADALPRDAVPRPIVSLANARFTGVFQQQPRLTITQSASAVHDVASIGADDAPGDGAPATIDAEGDAIGVADVDGSDAMRGDGR
jgi:hypothetical protein